MKYGGITWWRGNYGSILQAYALAKVMNTFDSVEYEIINQYGPLASAGGLLSRMKGKRPKALVSKLVGKYLNKDQRKRVEALERFVNGELPLSDGVYNATTIGDANEVYDAFVCGSDQIWNFAFGNPNPMYWLGFADEGKKKIAYAPSIGVSSLTDAQKNFVFEKLRSFDAVSCREQSGTDLINSVIGDRCVTVLDPTLLVRSESWSKLADESSASNCRIAHGYVFAYILVGNEDQKRYIEQFAHSKGLSVVCFPRLEPERADPYDSRFGDLRIFDANPADFIRLIRDADYVFTDSFHSTVFSILFHREFYVLQKFGAAQSSRLDNIMRLMGTGNRRIDPQHADSQIEAMEPIDWEKVDDLLHFQRELSMDYLRAAVDGKGRDDRRNQ